MLPEPAVAARSCPNCGSPMRFSPYESVVEEHHLDGPLSCVEFPMMAHRPGWKCQNPRCEYFEPLTH